MKRSKEVELNLAIVFGIEILFKVFTSKKSFATTCSIQLSGRQGRNYPSTSTYPFLAEKISI